MWIGCSRYQAYPDGFLCFIEPHESFVRKGSLRSTRHKRLWRFSGSRTKLLTQDAYRYVKTPTSRHGQFPITPPFVHLAIHQIALWPEVH